MEKVIICKSKYGSSLRYAKELARVSKIEIKEEVSNEDYVIYIAPVFAGHIYEIEKLVKMLNDNQRLLILACGLSDITKEHLNSLIDSNKDILGEDLLKRTEFRMLRGEIDYSKLTFKHKMMMKVMIRIIKKKDDSEKTKTDEELIKTYGKKISYIDLNSLDKVEHLLDSLA